MKVFVPFSEDLIAQFGMSLGELVPFDVNYACLRTQDASQEGEPAELEIELSA